MLRYVITYTSYKLYRDAERYFDKDTATSRFETLLNCANASDVRLYVEEV